MHVLTVTVKSEIIGPLLCFFGLGVFSRRRNSTRVLFFSLIHVRKTSNNQNFGVKYGPCHYEWQSNRSCFFTLFYYRACHYERQSNRSCFFTLFYYAQERFWLSFMVSRSVTAATHCVLDAFEFHSTESKIPSGISILFGSAAAEVETSVMKNSFTAEKG